MTQKEGLNMSTYIILSRFSSKAFDDPKHFLELAEQVSKKKNAHNPVSSLRKG